MLARKEFAVMEEKKCLDVSEVQKSVMEGRRAHGILSLLELAVKGYIKWRHFRLWSVAHLSVNSTV